MSLPEPGSSAPAGTGSNGAAPSANGLPHDAHATSLRGLAGPNDVVDPLDAERARLEAELAAVQARVRATRQRAATADAEVKDALRREINASRDLVADLERQHAESVALIERTTATEVRRILDAAQAPSAGHHLDGDGDG